MEALNDQIRAFLSVDNGSGYGSGYGDGSGYGSGYGDGSGDGSGYGSGYGDGSGDGSGYGSGSGYGDGDGSGSGYGDGDGSGYGSGYGDGSGYGSGYGDGSGDGSDLLSFCGQPVHYVDGIETVIERVHGNLARGYIVNKDLTTERCYVAKMDCLFAHGKTAREAHAALCEKVFQRMDPEEKVEAFLREFKPGKKYPAKTFYDWHNKLTGSCKMGRDEFVRSNGIDLEIGFYTVEEFVEITKNAYGGEVIRMIGERLKDG